MSIDTATPESCFITNLRTHSYHTDRTDLIEYSINYNEEKLYLSFMDRMEHWTDDVEKEVKLNPKVTTEELIRKAIEPMKHALTGLFLNNKLRFSSKDILSKRRLEKILNDADYPKNPSQKIDNLFLELFKLQRHDGEEINLAPFYQNYVYYKFYFSSMNELAFYLKTLQSQKYIDTLMPVILGERIRNCYITYEGLNHYLKLTNEGELSENCFVAMSFNDEENYIFVEAIEPAILETGFIPIKINKEHFDSDKTINDAIVASLKKCKFCIADFTKQKAGVYFESGYALGRNMKVIYTCREDDFVNCHFDTNHYPHIIYKDTIELKKRLIDKIEAYIL